MFPLTNKEPYIKPSGERTTLGDMFAQSGGDISELEHEVDLLQEASTEHGTQIQALTNELTDEAETRAELGAHNLINVSDYVSLTNVSFNDKTFTNTNTDTRNYCAFLVTAQNASGTQLEVLVPTQNITTTGVKKYSVTIPEGTKRLFIGHNGATRSLGATVNFDGNSGNYIFSVNLSGVDVTSAGGFVMTDIMILLATDSNTTYQPYAMTNKELTDAYLANKDNYILEQITQSVSVTADGTKTYKTLLNELYSALNTAVGALPNTKFIMPTKFGSTLFGANGAPFNKLVGGSTIATQEYTGSGVTSSDVRNYYVALHSSNSNIKSASTTTSGTTSVTEYTNQTPTNGATFAVYYDVYKKV